MQHSRAAPDAATPTPARRRGLAPRTGAGVARAPLLPGAVAALLVAALLGYVALTPLAPFAADTYGNEVRRHVILGGVIGAYVVLLLALRWAPPRTALDVPLLLVLLATAAGVAGSLDRRVSLEAVLALLPVAPLFYLLADRRLAGRDAVRRGLMLCGAVAAGFALASVWRQWQDWLTLVRTVDGGVSRATLLPPTVPRVEGVGSHPNVLGAMLAVVAPIYLLSLSPAPGDPRPDRPAGGARSEAGTVPDGRWAATRRPWPGRVVAGAGLALVLVALFFTLSRAAWAGAVAGLAVTALGMTVAAGAGRRGWLRWLVAGAAAVVVVGLVVAAAGRARPDWLFRDSLNPRADMRRVGVEIFRDNPLTGAGPGLYVALYPRYRGAHPFAAVHSHNIIIQVAADYGLVGLAAGAVLLAAVTVLVARRFLRGTPDERRIAAVVAGAVVAFLVYGMADSPHLFPESLLLVAAAVALLTGTDPRLIPDALRGDDAPVAGAGGLVGAPERKDHGAASGWLRRVAGQSTRMRWLGALPALAILAGSVALIPLWRYTDRAAAEHQRSVRSAERGRFDEAVAAAQRAVARDPRLAAYRLQLGAALASRYHERGDPADRDAAIEAFGQGLARGPANGAALVDLASLRLDAGDTARAWEAIDRLRGVAGHDNLLLLAAAVLVQQAGTPEEAVETYAGLLALNPTLAVTPFFRDDRFRSSHYDAIVDRALERAAEITGPVGAEGLRRAIRVLTGRDAPREDQLRTALAGSPDDVSSQVALGRLLLAGGRVNEAEAPLRAAVARNGDAADARAALGGWYAAVGDLRNARRQWLAGMYLGDVKAGDALGRSFAPGAVPRAVIKRQRTLVEGAFISRFYLPFQSFRFTYQRHEPVPIIGPGDWLYALPDEFLSWQDDLERWERGD